MFSDSCMFIYGEEYILPFFVINHQCILCSFQRSRPPERRKSLEYARRVVGVPGVEPGTSSLSGTRSNQLSYTPASVGGGNGIRTRDFQLAKLALYQLSYAPGGRLSRRALKRLLDRFHGPEGMRKTFDLR